MAGLQGLIHSPIEEGTPQKTVAPSPIESSDGSKSGPSGPAKQRRKAVTAGPAETPRPVSNKRPPSRVPTRTSTPLTIQAPVPIFPSPQIAQIEQSLKPQLDSPMGQDTPSLPPTREREGSALPQHFEKMVNDMATVTSNIAGTDAFKNLTKELQNATEKGFLVHDEGTPTATNFQHQTVPIPNIPSVNDLTANENSQYENLIHGMATAINDISKRLDRSLMNEEFFITQFLHQSSTLFLLMGKFEQMRYDLDTDVIDQLEQNRKDILTIMEMITKSDNRSRSNFNGLSVTMREQFNETKTLISSAPPPPIQPQAQPSPPRFTAAEKGKGPVTELQAARLIFDKVTAVETAVDNVAKQVAQVQNEQRSIRASMTPQSQRVSYGPDTPVQTQQKMPSRPPTPAPPARPPTPKNATKPKSFQPSKPTGHRTPKMIQGEKFFLDLLAKADTLTLERWARVITWGGWGPINSVNPEKRSFTVKFWNKKSEIDATRQFIADSITRAFAPGSYGLFLLPPLAHIGNQKKNSVNHYHWNNFVYSGSGPQRQSSPSQPITVQEPPMGPWYEDLFSPSQTNALSGPALPPIQFPPPPKPVTQAPIASFFPIETPAVPAPQTEVPWSTVGPKAKKTYSSVASKPPVTFSSTTPQVMNTTRRPNPPATNNWIVRYKIKSTGGDETMTKQNPYFAVKAINSLNEENKNLHRFKCVGAKWTEGNNLSLQFTKETKDTSLENSRISILQKLNLKEEEATFKKNVAWSKIIIRNVPAIAITDDDIEERMWSARELETELRSNEAFRNVEFTRPPAWACHPDRYKQMAHLSHANVALSFEDPDGSLAEKLVKSNIWMFAARVVAKHWVERIDLKQCTRCWELNATHIKCQEYCRICASTKHTETDHNRCCATCVAAVGDEGVRKEGFKCHHVRCKNCSQPAYADHLDCEARKQKITEVRSNPRNRVPANQPILVTSMYGPPRRPPRQVKPRPVTLLPADVYQPGDEWFLEGQDPTVDPRSLGHDEYFGGPGAREGAYDDNLEYASDSDSNTTSPIKPTVGLPGPTTPEHWPASPHS